ncbi:oxygenase MpaB family protein [Thermocrispum agreste]|uniref:oxygenase MpaB family protein n=1 Tax=Thermocrispum agreste TaxID=37925 RepID=UPI00041744E5|nr:oxygenase MpaB family protein [Thermocrispum agreste]
MTTDAARGERAAQAGRTTGPKPFGPDSLTWQVFGDWRGLLQALWAGSMQNMHPQLGAAVAQHSTFFDERMPRLFRSLYPIGGVVFDGDRAVETARQVRGYHDHIKGVDERGRRYHALSPDVFYWAHATFFVGTMLTKEYFCGGITEAERRQLFDEHVQWYRLYGVSMRPVPGSWEEFQEYYDHMCRNVLEPHPTALAVLDLSGLDKPPQLAGLPDGVWSWLRRHIEKRYVWLTVGMYHPAVRDKLGFTWSDRDERRLRAFGRWVDRVFRLLPKRVKWHPRAYHGWLRATGKLPPGTPLPETPRRWLPPESERGKPWHYSPDV